MTLTVDFCVHPVHQKVELLHLEAGVLQVVVQPKVVMVVEAHLHRHRFQCLHHPPYRAPNITEGVLSLHLPVIHQDFHKLQTPMVSYQAKGWTINSLAILVAMKYQHQPHPQQLLQYEDRLEIRDLGLVHGLAVATLVRSVQTVVWAVIIQQTAKSQRTEVRLPVKFRKLYFVVICWLRSI